MKKVFIYEIKKLITPYAIYLGIMAIICCSIMLSSEGTTEGDTVGMISAFILILIFGTLLYSFSYNKKKISADMHYGLPVTKRQFFIGKYLASICGILALSILFIGICFIFFAIAYGLDKIRYLATYPIGEQAYQLFLSSLMRVLFCIPLFNFGLLLFYKANTIIDGLIYIALGFGMVYFAVNIIALLALDYPYGTIFPIFVFTHGIDQLMYNLSESFETKEYIFYNVIYSLYAIAGYGVAGYLLWWSKKDSAIRTQEISNGVFGYKVFLPALALLVMLNIFVDNKINDYFGSSNIVYLIQFILITVGLFIGYCIYHRNFKFSKSSYIVLGVITGINLILMVTM